MGCILLPIGEDLSIPNGEFPQYVPGGHDWAVKTVYETRRERLEWLIQRHGGKLANLNEALGYERTSPKLSRLRNANARLDRPGKAYFMGDAIAREIEVRLSLQTGTMDTPLTYAEMHPDDRITHAMKVMESMTPHQLDQAVRVLDTLAEPPTDTLKNGTHDP